MVHTSLSSNLLRLLCLASLFLCAPLVRADLPLVDFDRMGRVGLAGSFAGFDFFSNSSSVVLDPSTSTLLSRSPDGALSRLASTNADGNILAGCVLGDTYYFAGLFSSVGNLTASNIASYTPSSGSFAALSSSDPNGQINALFCDPSRKKIWAGGSFTSPALSVAVWDVGSSTWSAPPFGGLQGQVSSITTNSSQSSLFFSGSFVASFSNRSVPLNGTNNPNVPFSTGATPFTSSLVPIPLQNAQADASPPSSDPDFSNIANVLCPSGADGPGHTWLARDGSRAVITIRKFSFLSASGIRLGNTFQQGRGTTGFSLTTIPDNAVQTLHYVDPSTGANMTCTDPCPLSVDIDILYQDFLFDTAHDITGFQLTLSEWTGAGSGLHILQLLSSGAFASSIDSDNGLSCFAPNPSDTQRTGNWTEKDANTDIPGTIQAVLVTSVAVGTPSASGATFTWMPYVSASGDYTVNMLIPGCTNFQDCELRTSVKVTIFPGGGLAPTVQTISQRNQADVVVVIYSGPVFPSSDTFTATVTMALADQPEGNGQDGKYELVADRVQLVLNSPNVTETATANGSNGTASGNGQRAFGFLEWPMSASGALNNGSVTALDTLGFDLLEGLGGGAFISGSSVVSAVAHHSSGLIFVAGDFNLSSGVASGASNIVAYRNAVLTQLPDNGLNGPVSALLIDGDKLFVAGSFSDTPSGTTQGKLRGVAMYDVANNQWVSMDGGVNGAAASLGLSNDQVFVAGNFSSHTSAQPSGFAAWNLSSGTWGNGGGFLIGSLTFVSNGTVSKDVAQILSGHITASQEFGASGFVLLQNGGNDGVPQVKPLNLPSSSDINTFSASLTRRLHARRSATGWFPKIGQLFKRQTPTASTLTPLPSATLVSAPAVLAGAFWTNSSSQGELTVIGGNFSFATNSGTVAQNLALYDIQTNTVNAIIGNPVNGSVHTLLVQGDELFVGGNFTVQGTNFAGFGLYQLVNQQWDTIGVQSLQGSSGAPVVVRSITASPSQSNTIIVAGSFAQAGTMPCQAICSFNIATKQWSTLGNGIRGEVASISYAGSTRDVIVASGSLALADGTVANVAQFSIANSTWTAVGDSHTLPGPVTALEVNDGNSNSIFAAGRASDGSFSYLTFWNGQVWQSLGSGFGGASDILQLAMVPLQDMHAANTIVEQDRMLLVSGSIADPSFGNASSVLFDGQQFIPYVVSSSPNGTPGTVSSLIHSISQFSFSQHHFLATGVVILISIAIAAGVVFLLALFGILWTLFSRRDDKLAKFDPAEVEDEDDSTHRPSSLLEHINAATRSTILGQSPFTGMSSEKETDAAVGGMAASMSNNDPFGPDGSNFARAETPSDAIVGGLANEDTSRPAHARYSFDGAGEGELPLAQGQEIEVLDDGDAAWWYARDTRTGREGVVPASYVY